MTGVEDATARPSASVHIDGFTRKDFEISFLLKRNNLEVSRKRKNRSDTIYTRSLSISIYLKDAIARYQVVPQEGIGLERPAVTTSALQGEYTAIAVDHAFS